MKEIKYEYRNEHSMELITPCPRKEKRCMVSDATCVECPYHKGMDTQLKFVLCDWNQRIKIKSKTTKS